MGRFARRLLLVLLVLGLAGCGLVTSRDDTRQATLDSFVKSLRYQLYPAAASHFSPELREEFLDRMEQVKGLNVTDVRLVRVDLREDGGRVDTRLEMDYYLLPSVTVKTLRIDQSWQYREKAPEGSGFYLTTAFPAFP